MAARAKTRARGEADPGEERIGDQGTDEGPGVVHGAVEAVGGAATVGGGRVGDERVSR